nr:helix-turn-helix domain-containing protein [Euzebyaceae bacterium]
MHKPAAPLEMSEGQRNTLASVVRSQTAPHRLVIRSRVLLLAADGVANSRIAVRVGVSVPTVRAW